MALLFLSLLVPAQADTFPPFRFNDLRIDYSVGGAVMGAPVDGGDFDRTRSLKGFASGNSVTFDVTLIYGWGGGFSDIDITCGDTVIHKTRLPGTVSQSYHFNIPVTGDVEVASIQAKITALPTGWGGFIEPRSVAIAARVTRQRLMPTMQVVGHEPMSDAKSVPVNRPIKILFSKELEPTTVHAGTVKAYYLTNPSAVISNRIEVSGRQITLHPEFSRIGKIVKVVVSGGETGVRGSQGEQLAGNMSWTFTTMPDVSVGIIPVQVVDGVDLVRNKPGVTRIKALWPDSEGSLVSDVLKLTADVSVTYDGTQTFNRKGETFYRFDIDSQKPSRIPKSALFKGNSANFYSAQGEMPILATFGQHTIRACVKPVGSFGQASEFTNQVAVTVRRHPPGWVSAYDGYSVLLVPVNVGGWQAGETRSTARLAADSQALFERMYPASRVRVEGQDTVWDLHYGVVPPIGTDFVVNNMLRNLSRYGRIRHDAIVGVMPHAWITNALGARGITGDIGWTFSHRAAFVSDQSQGSVVPHECGHMLSPPAPLRTGHTALPAPLEGYDLSRDRRVRYGNPGDNVFGYLFPLMYADIAAVDELASIWTTKDEYQHFMNSLTEAPGWFSFSETAAPPPAALKALEDSSSTTGVVFVDTALSISNAIETVAIDSVIVGEMGQFSEQPGTGSYSVKVLDAGGGTLQTCSFEPSWGTNSADGTPYAFFMGAMPYQAAARSVAVYHGTTQVASRVRSAHAPTVSVSAPGPLVTGTVAVAWSAADTDGDLLSFAISYSHDNGSHWTPAGFTVSNTSSFALDTTAFPGGTQCLVSVLANDGFNTGEATSTVFTVRNPPHVVFTTPGHGETNIVCTAPVRALFRDTLDPLSVTTNTLRVFTPETNPVAGTVSYDPAEGVVAFTPAEPLQPSAGYFAVLATNDLRDPFGQALATNLSWTFVTAPDSTPPTWTVLAPEPDSYEAPRKQGVFVVFDEPMLASSVSNGVGLLTAAGVPVPGTCTYDTTNRTARFEPTSPLDAYTAYQGLVGTGVCDVAGNSIGPSNITWSFTTGEQMEYLGLRLLEYQSHEFIDRDADGLWDQLAVRFRVEVLAAGRYGISAALARTNDEATVAQSTPSTTPLEAGRNVLTVYFEGADLRSVRPFNTAVRLCALSGYSETHMDETGFMPQTDVVIPLPSDLDHDGIEDSWELAHGLDFQNPADATADWDNDKLTNRREYELGFALTNADMDGDTLPDGWELTYGLNPTSAPPAWISEVPVTRLGEVDTAGPFAPYGTCHAVALVSNLACVADGPKGLAVIDISTPTNPALLGWGDTDGDAWGLAVHYPWVYVADDTDGLQVVDISAAANPLRRGGCDTPGNATAVALYSNTAYVADNFSGVQIIDISAPTNPVLAGSIAPLVRALDVQVDSNRLYLVDSPWLRIFDLSIPTNPVLVGAVEVTDITRVVAAGSYAYAGCAGGLRVIDVSDPANLVVLPGFAETPPGYEVQGFSIQSNLALFAERIGLAVADVTSPTNPFVRTHYLGDGGPLFRDAKARSNLIYSAESSKLAVYSFTVLDSDKDGLPDAWELRYFSTLSHSAGEDTDGDGVSNWGEYLAGMNPANPDENSNGRQDGVDVASYGLDPSRSDRDGDGLADVDEVMTLGTDPLRPDTDGDGIPDGWEHASGLNPLMAGDARGDADGDFLDNLAEYSHGLPPLNPDADNDSLPDGWEVRYGFDPQSTNTPLPGLGVATLGSAADTSWVNDVRISSNRACEVEYYALRVFDSSDPTNLVALGSYGSGGLRLRLDGSRAIVAQGWSGWTALDITQPDAITWLGAAAPGGYINDIAVGSNRVYAYSYSGLYIYDTTDMATPVLAGTLAGVNTPWRVDAVANLVYLADGAGGMRIIDATSPASPVQRGTYATASEAVAVTVVSNRAYISDYGTAMRIVDVSDPDHPVLLGSYLSGSVIYDIRVVGTLAYLACSYGGIDIVDVSNPAAPTRAAAYASVTGDARGLDVEANRVWVACPGEGLRTLEVQYVDADGDGLPDDWERLFFGSTAQPATADFDLDGLGNWGEFMAGLNPTNADQNANGISDGVEVHAYNMDPRSADGDVDGDGLGDLEEINTSHTNPGRIDTDGDGMPDGWEVRFGLAPTNPADALLDADHDGLSNLLEFQLGTCPTNTDTDGDSIPDGWEVAHGLNPIDPSGRLLDVGVFQRGVIDVAGYIINLDANAGYVSLAGSFGHQIIDVRSPTNPVTAGHTAALSDELHLLATTNVAYLIGEYYDPYLQAVDVSIPTNPVLKTSVALQSSGYAYDLAAVSNWLYVSTWYGTEVLDTSVPTNPVSKALCDGLYPDVLRGDGHHLYAEGARHALSDAANVFKVIDISTPTNPVVVGTCNPSAMLTDSDKLCKDIRVAGGYAYAAYGSNEVMVIDVREPTNPVVCAKLPIPAPARGLAVTPDYLFVGCWSYGVVVFDIRSPTNAVQCGEFAVEPAHYVQALDVCSNVISLAVNYNGDSQLLVLEWGKYDRDEDGLPDWWEQLNFSGSLAQGPGGDSDGDGISNSGEFRAQLNTQASDQDGDGLLDGLELSLYGTLPNSADTDNDGLSDGEEVMSGSDGVITNPLNPDSDGDGLSDGEETYPPPGLPTSNPTLADTDGDGLSDPLERVAGTNPRNASDCLAMLVSGPASDGGGVVIRWASASNRVYGLDLSTNLLWSTWQTVSPAIPATPPMNVYTDGAAGSAGPYFYRVRTAP